ncbi:OmpA family protein [Myxococcota bacterium]|jgi:outer membrane protein OmpA-like peptidoglycan-associated protein|nr:OmpA family protein [Myxococcota bacterium]
MTSPPLAFAPSPDTPLLGERWPLLAPLSLGALGLATALATALRLSAAATVPPVGDPTPIPTQAPPATAPAPAAPPPTRPPVPAATATRPPAECAPFFPVRFAPARAEADLDPNAARRLADWLGARPAARLVVNGHADVHGSVASNLALSHRRAQAVVSALVAAGAPPSSLSARGFGAYAPVPGAAAADQANRRVDFEIVGLPGITPCPLGDEAPVTPPGP